jgi:hypothetical protein
MNKTPYSNAKFVSELISSLGFSTQKQAITNLAKWLNLKESSVYNKVNGRSHFTIEELYIITQNTEISFDTIFGKSLKTSAYIPFYADGFKYKPRNYTDYILNITGYYVKAKQMTNVHGYFLANEVPMFHFLQFPNLLYLKLYVWNKINWNIPGISNEYMPSELNNDAPFTHATKVLKDQFYSFASSEIWTPYMLDNTISQIKYLRNMEILTSSDDIITIKKELMQLIFYLEDLTNVGHKPENSKGQVFECDIYITDLSLGSEVIMVKSDDGSMLFQQLDVPNYMHSRDDKLLENQYNFFTKIKALSIHITKSAEIEKNFFFKRMKDQLTKL